MTKTAPLLMSMSDIAALARVQRPVVSVWRSRAATTDTPFPAPVAHDRGQDLFDAALIGSWLAETGRGNNPDAAADAAAHASPSLTVEGSFAAITALLALRSRLGGALGGLSEDQLIDLADELDPDDELFFSEIEAAGEALPHLAQYVDDAVEAGYGEAAVFDRLVAEQLSTARGQSSLSPVASDLLAKTALALRSTMTADAAIVDLIGTSTDTLLAVTAIVDDVSVVTANTNDEEARLQRQQLAAHRIPHSRVDVQRDGSFAMTGHAVHVIRLTQADGAADSPAQLLSTLDRMILQLDSCQLAIVLAPSSVLSDGGLSRDADQVRSDLLRSERVRAIVRLPAGLNPRKPQQAHALWIVGDARHIELAQRRTMVADLSAVPLEPGVITDLVSDLAASLGDLATVRAHAFRFARLVLTRGLLVTRDSLVAGTRPNARSPRKPGAAVAVRIDELREALASGDREQGMLELEVQPASTAAASQMSTVNQLINAGHLRYTQGNRLHSEDILEADSTGFRIIGAAEVLGEQRPGSRRIDRLLFAAQYPAGRVTEPGDVVFCTSPRPTAIVDHEGTSVVAFPARILRINPDDPNGLVSDVVAADIAAVASGDRQWQSWQLRQTAPRERAALTSALAAIRRQREQAETRLAQLDELCTLLMTGVTAGAVTITSALPAPSEGTI